MTVRTNRTRLRSASAVAIVAIVAAALPALVSAARVTTPGAPVIMSVSSIRKSAKVWDLRVAFRAPVSNGGARVVSTTVSAGGRTCTARKTATSCILRNLPSSSRVTITARASNSRGPGRTSAAVRYVVGSRTWSRSAAATTTTTTAPVTTTVPPVRPFDVHVPPGYSAAKPAPLFVLLHGYGASGSIQSAYMGFRPVADSRGFLLVAPDGTMDPSGRRFWNATDACCDLVGTGVDDETYLVSIIESVKASYSVDPKRIYFVGHSNGGFMSYRMACRRADLVAGIANLAGAMFLDKTECSPSRPVTVLHIHGTNDGTINYNGGYTVGEYPGALVSARHWVAANGCSPTGDELSERLDLVADGELPGNDTVVTSWSGCGGGSAVQLWTIMNGKHTPNLADDFTAQVADFLLAHPRP